MVIGIGAGLGLLLGVVIAAAREMKDTSLKNLKDVRAYTQMAILGSVPLLENDFVVRRRRRMAWLGWTTACLMAAVTMAGSVVYYYYRDQVIGIRRIKKMSRVHDALRRAEKTGALAPPAAQPDAETRTAAATLDTGASALLQAPRLRIRPLQTAGSRGRTGRVQIWRAYWNWWKKFRSAPPPIPC